MPSLHPNANYLVTISGGRANVNVVGNAMAKLGITVENKWINILEAFGFQASDGAPTGPLSTAASGFLLGTGQNFLPDIATSHVWRGSSGIELSLDMRFDAVDNAITDVLQKVELLISAWMPTREGGNIIFNSFFNPPGPTPAEYLKSSGNPSTTFTVIIGNVMTIKNLIPTTISWEFENRFDTNGNPIAAMVKLGLISYTVPSASDMLGYFHNNATATGTNNIAQPSSAPADGTVGVNPAYGAGGSSGASTTNSSSGPTAAAGG